LKGRDIYVLTRVWVDNTDYLRFNLELESAEF